MRFTAGFLAPEAVEGVKHELDAWCERHEKARRRPRLLKALVPNLFGVFFWHDPAGATGARLEGQKIGPRLLHLKADWRASTASIVATLFFITSCAAPR